jgi:outer membrane receptor protein involved in Fe transport
VAAVLSLTVFLTLGSVFVAGAQGSVDDAIAEDQNQNRRSGSTAVAEPEGGEALNVDAGEEQAGEEKAETPSAAPASETGTGAPATQGGGGGESSAWAGIEEFVVTGYASSLVGDLTAANSVVAWSEEDLVALGAGDISDLAAYTPSLEIVTTGSTTPTFFIRGVGLNDFNANSTGSVAIYRDDIAINGPAMQLSLLFDTEAVNVLRGPQGVGQARNASAGAIKIYARKPSGDFSASFRSDFGNFDARDFEGALEMPLVPDILSARLSFRLMRRDGIMKNRCGEAPPFDERVVNPSFQPTNMAPVSICGESVPGGQASRIPEGLAGNVNDRDVWAVRGMFRFEPIPETSWILKVEGSRRDQLSEVGQFLGTKGVVCVERDKICESVNFGVPEDLQGTRQAGVLGGQAGAAPAGFNLSQGTLGLDVFRRLREVAPCVVATGPDRCFLQDLETRVAANRAQKKVARELARDLDSAPLKGEFDRTGPTTNDIFSIALTGEHELPGEIRMKTASGFDRYRRKIDIDLDFSPLRLFETITNDDGWQFFQSLSFDGILGEASSFPITWEVGGWFLREDLDARINNDFSDAGAINNVGVRERFWGQSLWSGAGYAELSVDILDDFTLDGGFRYNIERKEFNMDITQGGGVPPDGPPREFQINETWDSPTGNVRLTYRFNADVSVFWKYTRGWKPGSMNATASINTGPTVAKPERIDAFEMGLNGSWLDGALTAGGSFFFYDYKNFQVFTSQQFAGGNTEFVLINADNAEVMGVEIDGDARPWTGGLLQVRFAWLETQFLDFTRQDQFELVDTAVTRFQQNSGNPLLNSPRFKVSLTAQQEFSIGRYGFVNVRYDGTWTDKTFFDQSKGRGLGNVFNQRFLPDNTIGQEAFWLHNMRVGWRSADDRIQLAGWIRNIENKRFKTFAFDATSFQSTTIFFVGDPRTYGLSFSIKFF